MARHKAANMRRREILSLMGAGALAASLPLSAFAQTPNVATLKIGFIGAGREGGALGTVLAKAGHPVMFSSRHPDELKPLVDGLGSLAKSGTVGEAIDYIEREQAKK